jgi:hypothetical protein
MMNIKTLILMSVMAVAVMPTIRAETVTQIPGPFVPVTYSGKQAALSQFDLGATPPNLQNFATTFENFTFASSGVINSLSWIGQYEAGSPAPVGGAGPNFQVNFYTSLGATAGSAVPVATYNIGTANQTLVGAPGPLAFYSYSTTGTPFSVVGGTTYFASIVARLDYAVAGWGLAFSNIGTLGSVQDFGDLALTRFNDPINYAVNISAVPEPGSVAAILAVAGVVAVRRRRMAK